MKKRSNAIDSEQTPQGGGDMQFRRWEYWGFSVAVQRGNAASIVGTLFSPYYTDF